MTTDEEPISLAKYGAMRKVKTPAAMTAPYTRLQADARWRARPTGVVVGDLMTGARVAKVMPPQQRQPHTDLPESDGLQQQTRDAVQANRSAVDQRSVSAFVIEVDGAGDQ